MTSLLIGDGPCHCDPGLCCGTVYNRSNLMTEQMETSSFTVIHNTFVTTSNVVVSGLTATDLSTLSVTAAQMQGASVAYGAVLPVTCIQPDSSTGGQFNLLAVESPYTKIVQIQLSIAADSTVSVKALGAKYIASTTIACTEAAVNSAWNSGHNQQVATSADVAGYGIKEVTIQANAAPTDRPSVPQLCGSSVPPLPWYSNTYTSTSTVWPAAGADWAGRVQNKRLDFVGLSPPTYVDLRTNSWSVQTGGPIWTNNLGITAIA